MNALRDAESKVTFLNYLNTILLGIACSILTVVFFAVDKIKTVQEQGGRDVAHLQTAVEKTASDVEKLDTRVQTLERSTFKDTQSWVEANYVRKPQSK